MSCNIDILGVQANSLICLFPHDELPVKQLCRKTPRWCCRVRSYHIRRQLKNRWFPHQVAKLGHVASARPYEKKLLSFVISLQKPVLRPCEYTFSPKMILAFPHVLLSFLLICWWRWCRGKHMYKKRVSSEVCVEHPCSSFICIIARNEGWERSAFPRLVHSVYMNKRSFVSLCVSIERPPRQIFAWGQEPTMTTEGLDEVIKMPDVCPGGPHKTNEAEFFSAWLHAGASCFS